MKLDIADIAGATEDVSAQVLRVYVTNRDKHGQLVEEYRTWVEEFARVLALIGSGSTINPEAEGLWVSASGHGIWERTTLVYTYLLPDRFAQHFPSLVTLMHRYGREARQGEVLFDLSGGGVTRAYRIRKFRSGNVH